MPMKAMRYKMRSVVMGVSFVAHLWAANRFVAHPWAASGRLFVLFESALEYNLIAALLV